MISKRRNTASCFSTLAMNASRLTPLRYARMASVDSSMSRRRPVCLSSGINWDDLCEDRCPADGVAAALDGLPGH